MSEASSASTLMTVRDELSDESWVRMASNTAQGSHQGAQKWTTTCVNKGGLEGVSDQLLRMGTTT
jgi:hypothetical protein